MLIKRWQLFDVFDETFNFGDYYISKKFSIVDSSKDRNLVP
jgi:hypothetical protein